MTDKEKLDYIEGIARECFGPQWSNKPHELIDAHRGQALANIFALFEYDGATIAKSSSDATDSEDKTQITFDDLLVEGGEVIA